MIARFRNSSAQVFRFAIIGAANVGVDLTVYIGLLTLGWPIWLSKALAFICGTIFAYFANRTWTFRSSDRSLAVFASVSGLYVCSMAVNVSLNSIILLLLHDLEGKKVIAYVGALLPSAAMNFLGMKYLFRKKQSALSERSK